MVGEFGKFQVVTPARLQGGDHHRLRQRHEAHAKAVSRPLAAKAHRLLGLHVGKQLQQFSSTHVPVQDHVGKAFLPQLKFNLARAHARQLQRGIAQKLVMLEHPDFFRRGAYDHPAIGLALHPQVEGLPVLFLIVRAGLAIPVVRRVI